MPENTSELLKFIAEADEFHFVPRDNQDKDPVAFMAKLGIKEWYAKEIIKDVKEGECRSKYAGEPCDDPDLACEKMWKFVHLYSPIGEEPRDIYIKVGPVKTRTPDGKETVDLVIVISFHG